MFAQCPTSAHQWFTHPMSHFCPIVWSIHVSYLCVHTNMKNWNDCHKKIYKMCPLMLYMEIILEMLSWLTEDPQVSSTTGSQLVTIAIYVGISAPASQQLCSRMIQPMIYQWCISTTRHSTMGQVWDHLVVSCPSRGTWHALWWQELCERKSYEWSSH